MMAKTNEKKDTSGGTFIAERVKDLAVMYLTRRNDLEVKWQDKGQEWIHCIVEIKGKDNPARRVFGVELRGTMSPVTDDHANKVLHPSMQNMLRRGEFPFPACLLYFTMENNEGRFTWIAEPVLEDGKPVLRYHGEADTKKFDKGALDNIIEQINKWFDAMDADEGNVSCGECGTVLYGESSSLAPSERKPCPRCGSTRRAFSVRASGGIKFSSALAAQAEVITYPQSLLKTARDLINLKQYNSAIVMAHQACEIASERTIARALAGNKHESTKEIEKSLSSGYNLTNDQTRNLYTTLTGDDIQKQPFWQQFKEFASLRNQIVHGYKTASRSEAEAALEAATNMVNHLR
jgi:hypothetical protein